MIKTCHNKDIEICFILWLHLLWLSECASIARCSWVPQSYWSVPATRHHDIDLWAIFHATNRGIVCSNNCVCRTRRVGLHYLLTWMTKHPMIFNKQLKMTLILLPTNLGLCSNHDFSAVHLTLRSRNVLDPITWGKDCQSVQTYSISRQEKRKDLQPT